jgi:hypothetical protein
MKSFIPFVLVIGMTASAAALASDDCRTPMADWKPREAVTAHMTEVGITPERIGMDDGCYKVRGRDADGNRVELKIEPATLGLLELEVRFQPGANPSRYLAGAKSLPR